jgi:predicted Zn-dependent protease
VTISGNGGQAQFTGAAYNGDLRAYIGAAFQALAGQGTINFGDVQRTQINGIDAGYATAQANTQSGQVDVTVFAYAFDASHAYHFVVIAPAGAGLGPFASLVRSVRRMTAAEVAAVKPRKIQVLTVRSGDTVASLSARMAYANLKTERFLTLNAIPTGTALRPGQRVKIIIYG